MRDASVTEILIVPTSPRGLGDRLSPFDLDNPEELVYCCLFRSPESRSELLEQLKKIALEPAVAPDDIADRRQLLETHFDRMSERGETIDAFMDGMRWWVAANRRTYHAYSLRFGVGPYRTSCVISFRPLSAEMIKAHLDMAIQSMEVEREHVMQAFRFA